MALKISIEPTIEPVTLLEAKIHLRASAGSIDDNLESMQSIAPGAHIVAAAWSLVGTAVDVLGYSSMVILESGTNGAGGTVDVKLQHSDDNTTWADVTSGSFTQVTTSNDNATYEKEYTGGKRYLRVVCTVAGNTCEFGVSIIKQQPTSEEDTLIESLITTARQHIENILRRALCTQSWELWLDKFPDKDYIEIPLPPLLVPSVTAGSFVTGTVYRILAIGTTDFTLIGASANTIGTVFTATGAGTGTGTATASCIVKYYGTDDTEYSISGADYLVDIKSEPGRICLNYGKAWPTTTLRDFNGVCIIFICGYGGASSVPKAIKQAILLLIGHLFEHREAATDRALSDVPMAIDSLLYPYRIFGF